MRLLASDFGVILDDCQLRALDRYATWLLDEATLAGGIGPNEADSVVDRHLLDSLSFLAPLEETPGSLLDIGTGVGLPGIPLAVALPETDVVLVDRSGRRCTLLNRAIRVLDLENVEVMQVDISEVQVRADVAVSRASLPPSELLPHLRRLTRLGIVAGSTRSEPTLEGYQAMKIESRYLETPRWLLIMRQS
jgi:16S rRNA (guanine(527)-N(7))-methyltransferase RsmG